MRMQSINKAMSKEEPIYTTLTAWTILVVTLMVAALLLWTTPEDTELLDTTDSTFEQLPLDGDSL
jgi:hypothetical protein